MISVFTNVVKNNFANFNGRARRKEYWMFQLAVGILLIGLVILGSILSFISGILGSIVLGITIITMLAIIIPSFALSFRRMQDIDKPGWFMFIPVYSFILSITEGTRGDNQYGPDPKA